jgi:hypothetical protein
MINRIKLFYSFTVVARWHEYLQNLILNSPPMKNLTERFKDLIPFLANSMMAQTSDASFDFIRSKKKMVSELEYCLRNTNLVGVYCPLLGNGMFLVGVENIVYGDDGILIVFYSHDMSGHTLSRRTLHIDEITMIVPFNNPYIAPIAINMRAVSIAS